MKKIMFNDRYGLTKAVLEGRKTMTRRIVPECRELNVLRSWEHNEGAIPTGYEENTHSFRFDYCPDKKRRISIDHLNIIPSYKVGEVVAVAQSYGTILDELEDPRNFSCMEHWESKSGDRAKYAELAMYSPGGNNKMFVCADEMPHQIRITGIRVERLQDISDEDCLKEGIYWDYGDYPYMATKMYKYDGKDEFIHPKAAFAALIKKISGKWIWNSNPWVFVYEFELVK